MEGQSTEVLRRIEEQLTEFRESVERRLELLERKVEQQSNPPMSVERNEAQRLLGCGKTKLQEMISDGRIQTCDWSRDHIPMSELIRATVVRQPTRGGPPPARTRRSKAYDPAEEAAKVLEAQRLRKLQKP